MIRIQLHLPDHQDRRLRALARKKARTRAELIRQGIELVLRQDADAIDPLLELIGAAGPAARTDLSERHDDYLHGEAKPAHPTPGEPWAPK